MVMAKDQVQAEAIGKAVAKPNRMRSMHTKVSNEEDAWPVHTTAQDYMERMTTKKGDSTNANNTSHTKRLFHEGNYITSAYKKESVGMGYDYSECLSDDEDALMDTTTDTYIGYTSYRGHFHKTQMQSALGNDTLTPLSHLKSPSVESKGPEHVSTSTLSKSTPKMNGPPISRLPLKEVKETRLIPHRTILSTS